MNMDFRGRFLLVIFPLCLVYMYTVYAQRANTKPRFTSYSQNEIDDTWKRMVKRESLYAPWNNQTGCWPNNLIPFVIGIGFTKDQIQNIYRHIFQIQNKTCIRWVEKTWVERAKKVVEFVPLPDDADAEVCSTRERGSFPSGVTVNLLLGGDCFEEDVVIHEMLHALGLIHEHQRIDRDCYVEVHSRKLNDPQFLIIYNDLMFERWPYDKRSITHYNRDFFVIKDKNEGFWDLPWNYRLGDSYGLWGKHSGQLTCMDVQKLNYRFCGGPDYCDIHPIRCDEIEEQENKSGCKQLYEDIATGVVKPTNKRNR